MENEKIEPFIGVKEILVKVGKKAQASAVFVGDYERILTALNSVSESGIDIVVSAVGPKGLPDEEALKASLAAPKKILIATVGAGNGIVGMLGHLSMGNIPIINLVEKAELSSHESLLLASISMTVSEMADLRKKMEQEYGIDALKTVFELRDFEVFDSEPIFLEKRKYYNRNNVRNFRQRGYIDTKGYAPNFGSRNRVRK